MSHENTPEDSQRARETHSVWGRVVEPNGNAVPAEVFWVDAAHADKETVGLFDVHKVATADQEGRFWAPDLPAGPCLLVVDFKRLGVLGDQVRIEHGRALTVPVADDEVVLEFPFTRTDFGAIFGVVRDPIDNRPGSRVTIALRDEQGDVVRKATTGTNGVFEFQFLPSPATYELAIWGTARHLHGKATLELGKNKRIDAKVDQQRRAERGRGRAVVRVLGHLGLPVRGAEVTVTMATATAAPVTTNKDGVATFDRLPERPLAALAAAPGYAPAGVQFAAGDATAGGDETVEGTIELPRAVRVRVAVEDAETGRPVRHANVRATHDAGDVWIWGGVLPPPDQPPRDHQEITVREGSLIVAAESPGYARATITTDVAADDAENAAVTLHLTPRP